MKRLATSREIHLIYVDFLCAVALHDSAEEKKR